MTATIPEAATKQHIIILGKTGSGKSSTMRGIAEERLDKGKRVAIIDPKGDWYGLKLSASGKRAGYPVVIFGGKHADVPIDAHSGRHVAELIASGNRPCIIDLKLFTVADRTTFFIAFAEALFKHNQSPIWLFIDECHNFAPQGKAYDIEGGKLIHWSNKLGSEGRGTGINLISASQRPQKVHKDYVTCHETLIAMRVIHPLDRNAIKEWIDGCDDPQKGKEVLTSLAGMKRGEGWVWSPEINFGPVRVKFPMFKTYDSFKAPTGETPVALTGWASVDLEEVKAKLANVVAEAKANDPRELKAQIATLKRELATKATSAVPTSTAAAVSQAHFDRAARDADKVGYKRGYGEGQRRSIELHTANLTRIRAKVIAVFDAGAPRELPPAPELPPIQRPAPIEAPAATERRIIPRANANGSGGGVGGAELRVLRVLAARAPARFTLAQWATLSKLKRTGGTWQTYVSRLRVAGLFEERDGLVDLTPAGFEAAGDVAPPQSGSVTDDWKRILGIGPSKMIDEIVAAHPQGIERVDLAERVDLVVSGGTLQTYLSRLKTNGLVEVDGSVIKASETLFLDGRRS